MSEIKYQEGFRAGFEAARKEYYAGKYCVELPCKPGDIVYILQDNVLTTHKCTGFWIAENWVQIQLLDGRTFTCWDGIETYLNKTLFVDIELALAEWEKVKND